MAGPLRGARWLACSRGKLLRVLSGRYEPEQTDLFVEHVRPGDTVFDVGAHAGYYTLLASTLVGPSGRVCAFEPDPGNVRALRGNVETNGCTNVRIEEAAVADGAGTARFGGGSGSGTGRLTEEGEREVSTLALDDYAERSELVPSVVKIDVEGAEHRVLRGASVTLRRASPVLFLSLHGRAPRRACLELLGDAGYRTEPIVADDAGRPSELLCLPGRS